jgi:hypothetical protein
MRRATRRRARDAYRDPGPNGHADAYRDPDPNGDADADREANA